jgi:hypothetical protein
MFLRPPGRHAIWCDAEREKVGLELYRFRTCETKIRGKTMALRRHQNLVPVSV